MNYSRAGPFNLAGLKQVNASSLKADFTSPGKVGEFKIGICRGDQRFSVMPSKLIAGPSGVVIAIDCFN